MASDKKPDEGGSDLPGNALRPPFPRKPAPKKRPPKRNAGFAMPRGLDCLVLREDLPARTVDSLVPVAKLGKTFGIRGEITVRLYNPDSDLAWAADAVHLRGEAFPMAWVSVQRWEDKGGKLLAKFEGVHNPQDARALTHLEVLVPTEDLSEPEDDELFVNELLGMRVIDEKRGDIGTIAQVLTIGPNDVWVVQGDVETMIPAVAQFVHDIDREARVARVFYEVE
jgi:16S rRNA processing protein RimM